MKKKCITTLTQSGGIRNNPKNFYRYILGNINRRFTWGIGLGNGRLGISLTSSFLNCLNFLAGTFVFFKIIYYFDKTWPLFLTFYLFIFGCAGSFLPHSFSLTAVSGRRAQASH